MSRKASSSQGRTDVRDRILATASDLFYKQGVRAVGVDLVVEKAGVAKTSLYRHFGTKDDLVVAFLQRMDQDFWQTLDTVNGTAARRAKSELPRQVRWIGERASQ